MQLIYHVAAPASPSEEHPAHRALEVLDVVAHDLRRHIPFAERNRLQERPVLEHCGVKLAGLLECQHPDAERERVVLLERRLEKVVVSTAVDRAVDALIEIDQRLVVARLARAELIQQLAQSIKIKLRGPLGRQARRLGLEHRPNLAEARQISHVDGRDEDAAAGIDLDELLLRQATEGLAHGGATDLEALDQLPFVHDRARRKLERDDQLANRKERLIGKRQALAGRRDQRPSYACPSHGDILLVSSRRKRSRRKDGMGTTMLSSLEIAQQATLRPITEIAAAAGLEPGEVEPYGRYKAKIDLGVLDRLAAKADGKLIDVTAITPTKAGEGKTTTSVSLTQGLGHIGRSVALCLREASLGPVFGIKGGAAGGGYTQVVPMEDLNLHFTGDIHAIGAANNLLAAMIEAHILHGNKLGIDPLSVSWRRCIDINDRALRDVAIGLGGRANGYPRQTGFDITAASEVMAIAAVASDLQDLRRRLGAITVANSYDGEPVTAEQLRAAGSMAVLLKETIKPNLVQTLEGQPAFVHCGPFANIAHGNNSVVADRVALKLADYVVTESGFGSDMGMEKFFDIVCRLGNLRPDAVVLVATVKALKHHAQDPDGGAAAIETGGANLARHLSIVREFGLNAVVAVNRFPGDTEDEVELVKRIALEHGAYAAEVNDGFSHGGAGAAALAEAVVAAADEPASFDYLYPLDAPIEEKIDAIAKRAYGADGVFLQPAARAKINIFNKAGLGGLPICMAKTHLSLSHDPTLANAPSGFTVGVRDLRAYTGAGWIVALCGDMQTMPGLGKTPAAFDVDIDENGETVGLF
jgi:formate--tetrahydrofolate ligase